MAKLNLFKGKKKKVLLVGGGLVAAWFLLKGKTGQADPFVSLKPAEVKKGETVSAATYRQIASKRSGMSYVPVEGNLGGELTFTPSKTGWFTRNVVQGDSGFEAEIA